MSEDSSLSASDLRRRYHKGGSAADSELSASQLRSRYNVQPNAADFSTRESPSSGVPLCAILLLCVGVVGGVAYLLLRKG